LELTALMKLISIPSVRFELTEVSVLLVPSTAQSRFQAKVGEPVSLMEGGAGILAGTPSPEDLERLLDGVEKIPLASGKVLSREEFIENLDTIRECGYVLGEGLGNRSEFSVTVPVLNRAGEVVAAI
jgi:DNA-binding IclR family transcriptional regulator